MKKALAYYLALPFIYAIAMLPFPLLYVLSDFTYLILYKIIGYRKKVVFTNLKNALPDKTEKEFEKIAKEFYHFFCDMIFESVKLLLISEKQLKKNVLLKDRQVFESYFKAKQNIIMVMGHFGNWELASPRFNIENLHHLQAIYHPLSNTYFNRLVIKARTRHGSSLIKMNETYKAMIGNKSQITTTAFIADQTPMPNKAYWTTFLNQETPIFRGTALIAKKLDWPLFYMTVKRIKRGHYEIRYQLLAEHPTQYSEEDLTEMHVKALEKDIINQPETWLWSHRRWKFNRQNKL
jgi:Kdo2-lipid IVA lauroyltransferase/acyltransferase